MAKAALGGKNISFVEKAPKGFETEGTGVIRGVTEDFILYVD
ncbi:hypothetical protein [Photobacterium swingsii]